MENMKFAVLIDAENISVKYLSALLDELTKYGITTYRRIYGDFTSSHTGKWKDVLLANSITPIQQYSNTVGKNASDSTLIIDAMDILYTGNVDGFCIVSSDGDFTRLASRLRESGMMVIGMGEEKTPRSFRNACNIFTSLENLIDQNAEDNELVDPAGIAKNQIDTTIVGIVTENENKGKSTYLGEIGSRLQNKYPDFDVRNYGYSLLSKFLEEVKGIELKRENSSVRVFLKEDSKSKGSVIGYITALLNTEGSMTVSDLSNKVHLKYHKFSPKDYGYSQFTKFLQSIGGMSVTENDKKQKIVSLNYKKSLEQKKTGGRKKKSQPKKKAVRKENQ